MTAGITGDWGDDVSDELLGGRMAAVSVRRLVTALEEYTKGDQRDLNVAGSATWERKSPPPKIHSAICWRSWPTACIICICKGVYCINDK